MAGRRTGQADGHAGSAWCPPRRARTARRRAQRAPLSKTVVEEGLDPVVGAGHGQQPAPYGWPGSGASPEGGPGGGISRRIRAVPEATDAYHVASPRRAFHRKAATELGTSTPQGQGSTVAADRSFMADRSGSPTQRPISPSADARIVAGPLRPGLGELGPGSWADAAAPARPEPSRSAMPDPPDWPRPVGEVASSRSEAWMDWSPTVGEVRCGYLLPIGDGFRPLGRRVGSYTSRSDCRTRSEHVIPAHVDRPAARSHDADGCRPAHPHQPNQARKKEKCRVIRSPSP